MKFLTRFLTGSNSAETEDLVPSILNLFHSIIKNQGNILKSKKLADAEKSHVRLAAANSVLKLARKREFYTKMTSDQFVDLAFMMLVKF